MLVQTSKRRPAVSTGFVPPTGGRVAREKVAVAAWARPELITPSAPTAIVSTTTQARTGLQVCSDLIGNLSSLPLPLRQPKLRENDRAYAWELASPVNITRSGFAP